MKLRSMDIETYQKGENGLEPILDTRKFVLGGVMTDKKKYIEFKDRELMSKFIIEDIINNSKKENTFYYGHSMAYDFYGVFADYIEKSEIININNEYEIECFCLYPFIAYFKRKSDNKIIGYFLDSLSFFRSPLKDVGKMIGFNKLEMPEKIQKIEELSKYLERDCEIVIKGMLHIKQIINNMGFFPKRMLTAGNVSITSFLTYARKNNLHGIFSWGGKTFQGIHMEETRSAFRGGRVECFQKGKFDNCISIDVNSMYSFIMKNMEFPDLKSEFKVKGEQAKRYFNMLGVVRCKIISPSPDKLKYAYLPIRMGEYVFFPFEKIMTGTWTTLEIKRALDLGYKIKNIEWGIFYQKSKINPFKEYVKKLYEGKKTSKGVEKQVYKILLNSLYGKFGQNSDIKKNKIINRSEFENYKVNGWEFVKTIDNQYLIEKKIGKSVPRYANPMISTLITAGARDYLWTQMMKIPKEKLIYVNTDSLIIKAKDLKTLDKYNINIGDEMGMFKIEDKGDLTILGENRYKINNNIKMGGIPKRNINEETFKKGKVKIKKMISIKSAIKTNELKGRVGTFYEEEREITDNAKNDIILPKEIIEWE